MRNPARFIILVFIVLDVIEGAASGPAPQAPTQARAVPGQKSPVQAWPPSSIPGTTKPPPCNCKMRLNVSFCCVVISTTRRNVGLASVVRPERFLAVAAGGTNLQIALRSSGARARG